jgi:L-alanine-DL-glutamate epimerase-like enolase superfamily enzyme
MPKEAFEFGMKNGNLLNGGKVVAPDGSGLGIKVDWDSLPTADFHAYEISVSPE